MRKASDPKVPTVAEKDIQKAILQYLKMRGYLCKRNNSGMQIHEATDRFRRRVVRIGEAGWPDIEGITKPDSACGGGKYFGIEVKTRIGAPTPEQIRIGQEIIKNGGIWFIAREVDEVIARGF